MVAKRKAASSKKSSSTTTVKKITKIVNPKHIYGVHKSWTTTNPAFTQITSDATRQGYIRCSDISTGDLYNNRNTNSVWMNNVQFFLNVRNAATSSRYIRVLAFTLVNGSVEPDDSSVPLFEDIYTTNNFASVVGATGLAEDTIYRVNRQVYQPLYDKVLKIPGTSNGESNSRNFKLNIPIRRVVTYNYNANTARRNPIWLLWQLCEAEGVAVSSTVMAESYRVTTHFKEILK